MNTRIVITKWGLKPNPFTDTPASPSLQVKPSTIHKARTSSNSEGIYKPMD